MAKTWFITGTSRGFGREWAQAALERGDRVAATARAWRRWTGWEAFGERCCLALDVTDRDGDFAAVRRAAEHFGLAGRRRQQRGLWALRDDRGAHRGRHPRPARDERLGALWVTQAALPIMRAQGSGHIIQVSSIGGITRVRRSRRLPRLEVGARGLLAGARAEVARLRHPRDADRAGRLFDRLARALSVEAQREPGVRGGVGRARAARGENRGDPKATRAAIFKVVDADPPPLRIFLGARRCDRPRRTTSRASRLERVADVAVEAHGED